MAKKAETILQKNIMDYMTIRGWYCRNTHGNTYQAGFPDFYAAHKSYGTRWIEVKRSIATAQFTPAQMEVFPEFAGKGVGIWILIAATEKEYNKLFKPANWHTFLGVMK
jgi:hypothetical protein